MTADKDHKWEYNTGLQWKLSTRSGSYLQGVRRHILHHQLQFYIYAFLVEETSKKTPE